MFILKSLVMGVGGFKNKNKQLNEGQWASVGWTKYSILLLLILCREWPHSTWNWMVNGYCNSSSPWQNRYCGYYCHDNQYLIYCAALLQMFIQQESNHTINQSNHTKYAKVFVK